MRDFHQSRVQKIIGPKEPSPKGQTQKFRLGKENLLKPWVPVKSQAGKRERVVKSKALGLQTAGQQRHHQRLGNPNTHYYSKPEDKMDTDIATKGLLYGGAVEDSISELNASNLAWTSEVSNGERQALWTSHPHDELPDNALEYPVLTSETARLFQSPGAGMADPFAALSVLITPRIQLLLHHYCKLPLYSACYHSGNFNNAC